MNDTERHALLEPLWNAWADAERALRDARTAYEDTAQAHDISICTYCAKPMPTYDTSMQCDGCHLPYGWCTPEGEKRSRRAKIEAQLAQLQKEKDALE